MRYTASLLVLILLAPTALAQDDDAPRLMDAEWCFGTKRMAEQMRKFAKLKPEKRDRVGASFEIAFTLEPGEAPPERIELRDGETVRPIALTRSGDILRSENIGAIAQRASDTAKICTVDPARAGRPVSDPGYQLDIGMGVRFLETPGTHGLSDIEDGLKDGRSHWKKMAGAMGFMVPKFDHIAVATDDRDNPPTVTALKDGQPIGAVEGEYYDGARLVPMDALEDMGADAIRVEAAVYRLTPSPDAKTVARFSGDGE